MELTELVRRLRATTLFSPLPQERLRQLLEKSPRLQSSAGEWIAAGPEGLRDHLVLLSGEVETLRHWTKGDGAPVEYARPVALKPGGPGFALIGAGDRQLRVRALRETTYLAIDGDRLDDLLGWTHLGAYVLPEPHLKIFHRLPLEKVAQAINCLKERPVEAGETVIVQDEPGQHYFVILSGEAEVRQTDPATGGSQVVNRLSDGDGFGEEALLAEGRRTATVTMTTPGALLVLRKSDFDALLRPSMVAEVEPVSARDLLAKGNARLLDCRSPAEYAQSRLPGAASAPLDDLRHDAVYALEPEFTYVVYCRNGRRSRAAAFLLHERGMHALSLAGGIAGWPFEVDASSG